MCTKPLSVILHIEKPPVSLLVTFILFYLFFFRVTINFATILRPCVSEMPYLQGPEGIVVYSISIALKQFRVGIIICTICGSFDYLIYPYSPAYIPSCYHFVISVDNSKGIQPCWINFSVRLLYRILALFSIGFFHYSYLYCHRNSVTLLSFKTYCLCGLCGAKTELQGNSIILRVWALLIWLLTKRLLYFIIKQTL